ncbi:MAG: hypothetical protein EOP84_06320 [Verrucomicrobiaceae bacterium]|nr:MAG: hypothetical protein EOP84_06320 [Verrucomicrobiaceae bacterium]
MNAAFLISLALCFLVSGCVSFNGATPETPTQRARVLDQFAGTYANESSPSRRRLSDALFLHYIVSEPQPSHVALCRTPSGFEAVAFHGSRAGHRRVLTEGTSFTFSGERLNFGSESSRYDNQFYLTNIKSRSTTRREASLSPTGDLVFSYSTTTSGTNWGIPMFNASRQQYVFKRIR